MAIGIRTGSESGIFKDAVQTPSQALGANVEVGDLIVIMAARESGGASDPPAAADCSKLSGTATIGTVDLDHYFEINLVNGPGWVQAAVWSCIVTGAGSLTMQVNAGASQYWGSLSVGAYSGSWGASRKEVTNGAGDASDTVTAASSGSVTPAGAALLIGVLASARSDNNPITQDAAWTLIAESEDGSAHAIGSVVRRIITTSETRAAQWTLVTGHYGYAALVVAYKEEASGVALAGDAAAAATAVATLEARAALAAAAVAQAVASGTLSSAVPLTGAAIASALGEATLEAFTRVWRMPINTALLPNGVDVYVSIWTGVWSTYTLVTKAPAVTAGGFVDIPAIGTPGTKALAMIHNWDDSVDTLSIKSGAGIATITEI